MKITKKLTIGGFIWFNLTPAGSPAFAADRLNTAGPLEDSWVQGRESQA